MKKLIYILFLFPYFALAQVSNGTEFEQEAFRATNNQTVTTSTYVLTQGADGTQGKILGENISLSVIPPVTNFTPLTQNLYGYFKAIDLAIGNQVATTAGISTRVWWTADATTITAGTFYLTNATNKGTAPSAIQSVINDDNQKKYYTQDLIGIPHPTATIYPVGVYAGNLSASTTPNSAQQRWTVELYKCDTNGTPIASGITGAPVGVLGVTVITILDSGLLTLADGSVTNVPVSGNLASPLSMAVGERIRYHVSAEKVGTTASNITQSVYYGNSYNSYLDVPVPLNTTAVKDLSTVTNGTGTTTDALNTLNTTKENKQTYIRYADDYANLTDAINATPAGGTLILGNHTYTGNISITRDNINIVGSKMPAFHATLDQLVGGSIINGPFIIDGQNVSLSNIGIDSGTAQCIALNSGNPMEGLVMHDIAATDLNFNNSAENVISIVKANTTMHAILLEGLANSTFRNVHGKGGDFGVVLKISDSNASDIYGYESRTTNVYIKSDSYAPCLRSNFNNINSVSNVITASQPVAVHASTSNLFDVNVNNVSVFGGTRQFRLIASPAITPSYAMSNVNVSNVTLENGVDVGLDTYGIVSNSTFNNVVVRNTVSGQGVYSNIDGRGINFNNIRFDDNSGNNLDTAIDIRSFSVLNNIVSIRNADQTSLGGINLNNFANSSKIGIYVGNLKINSVSVNRDKLTGQGTINFLPKYETAGILKNSLFYEDGLNAGINTTSLYSLGAGTSILSVQNTTGSGFATQVNNNAAMVMRSSSTLSALIETRNLPLVLNTNSAERIRIHASGGISIGNSTDPGATNLSVTGNIIDAKLTNNPTAPTATAGDNDTSIATTAFVMANARPYKTYYALITQSGTGAPTATVIENTLGGTVVWTRNVAGEYFGTLTGAFTSNKTGILMTGSTSNVIVSAIRGSADFVIFRTTTSGTLSDTAVTNATLEIRVYP